MDRLDAGSNAPHVRGSVEVLRLLRSAVEDRGARGVVGNAGNHRLADDRTDLGRAVGLAFADEEDA